MDIPSSTSPTNNNGRRVAALAPRAPMNSVVRTQRNRIGPNIDNNNNNNSPNSRSSPVVAGTTGSLLLSNNNATTITPTGNNTNTNTKKPHATVNFDVNAVRKTANENGVVRYNPKARAVLMTNAKAKTWREQLENEKNAEFGDGDDEGMDDGDGNNINNNSNNNNNNNNNNNDDGDNKKKKDNNNNNYNGEPKKELGTDARLTQLRFGKVQRIDPISSSWWYTSYLLDCAAVLIAGALVLGMGVWMYYEFGSSNFSVWFLQAAGVATGSLAWLGFSGAYFRKISRMMTATFFMMFMFASEFGFVTAILVSTTFQSSTATWLFQLNCTSNSGASYASFCFCDASALSSLPCVRKWVQQRQTLLAAFVITIMVVEVINIVCSFVLRDKILSERKQQDEIQGGILVGFLRSLNVLLLIGVCFLGALGLTIYHTSWLIVVIAVLSFLALGILALAVYALGTYNFTALISYIISMGCIFILHMAFTGYMASSSSINDASSIAIFTDICSSSTAAPENVAQYCRCDDYDPTIPSSAMKCVTQWMSNRITALSGLSVAIAIIELGCFWGALILRKKLLRIAAEKELGESDEEELADLDD